MQLVVGEFCNLVEQSTTCDMHCLVDASLSMLLTSMM